MAEPQTPNRPAPAAQGRLAKTPVLHLLLYAQERRLTGTIELTTPTAETAAILFLDGQPTKVKTSDPVAYLGRVLLELGHITGEQLDRSLAQIAREKRLHGQLLVEWGVIDDKKLQHGLREQLVRKLHHMVSFAPETTFSYYDGFDALVGFGADDVVQTDPLPIVWSAVRAAPPWEHVSNALTRVAMTPLRVSKRAELHRFDFSAKELELIEFLRQRPMRVAELTATELLKPREIQLLVYCLLITKQVQVVQEGAGTVPPPRLDHTPSARPAPVISTTPMGTPSPATPEQVNAMSFSLRASATPPVDLTPRPMASPKAPLMTPSGSQLASTKIASPLPPAPGSATPLPQGAHGVRRPSAPMPAVTAAQLAALTPELRARRKEVVERAEYIDREDYFQMLDVDRKATSDEVRESFFKLAKVWHPDRLSEALTDVRDACGRVFARMSEAHQTLTDAKKRERYMTLLTEGGATPEAQATIALVVEAATNFMKAEICLKRNDLAQAEALCKQAHDADPQQPDYLALLAWLRSMKPEGQTASGTQGAIKLLDRAVGLSERCERAYFYRGQLHKRLGSTQLAMRDFRKAAELNPRNIDAVREVRLHEMRAQKGGSVPPPAVSPSSPPRGKGKPEAKPSGLFKFFKK